ncbi:MAG: flagellar biosynthesis anti-sigma factor FlgM [Chloroflexi bacterium]|nr:flagellar biosynthesis anti-sigma factor FlgM [Chloroflexota bacterium]
MNRIDGLNPLSTSRTRENRETGAVDGGAGHRSQSAEKAASGLDQVSLSGRGRGVARAAAAVLAAPDVREARVAALKAAIAGGTYNPDPADVAARLLASGSFGD